MDLYDNKYRVPSVRLEKHFYDGGLYFVTICTHGHDICFGTIEDGDNPHMTMWELGRYAEECIRKIGELHSGVTVHEYVVMPNHIHLLIEIERDTVETSYYDVSHPHGNGGTADLRRHGMTSLRGKMLMSDIGKQNSRLSQLISKFKSAVTKYARAHGIPFSWQARYHEHVVDMRSQVNAQTNNEYEKITYYIRNNVYMWKDDKYHIQK